MARARCPGCHKRQGESTIAANGGKCVACGASVALLRFKRDYSYRMAVGMSNEEQEKLFFLAQSVGRTPVELMEAAVLGRLFVWSSNEEQLKQDLMLTKLARPDNG